MPRSLKKSVTPCSICNPPEARGPVLMVRNPTRSGAACATAAGILNVCAAAPTASAPLTTVRRLMPIDVLPGDFLSGLFRLLWLDVLVPRPSFAVVDRLFQELVRVVGPELADVRIGLDDGVDELAALLFDLADVDVADHVAVLVERHRAAGGLDI